ncbi:MAG: SRPBCC family protein [Maricaulaceae bacterium]
MTRRFNAPVALVYRAYTEPALLQRWLLGPPGWTLPVCEMDVRVGGKLRWRWRSEEDGKGFGFDGAFKEVVPQARLAHTQTYYPGDVGGSMGEEAFVTIDFAEDAGQTIVTSTIDYGSKENRNGAMSTGMTDGMEMSYQQLDALLTEQSA